MTDYNPIFRSPIAVQAVTGRTETAGDRHLTLSDLTGVPVILIQGDAGGALQERFGQIPANPGDLVEAGAGLLGRLTLTEFYLFGKSPAADLPTSQTLDDSFARANLFAHTTDYGHGRAALRLTGSDAPDLLSKICGLDFHDSVFPSMRLAQTSAAKIKTLIARYDEGDTPAYFLHVNRPYGQYFWEIVWDAGQEFGLVRGADGG